MRIVDVLLVTLVMILWAVCFPLITTGIEYAPHLTFATLRALLAGASLVFLAFILGRRMPEGMKNWTILIGVGFGATTLGFLGMFHAAEFVSPGVATVIANTQPLLAAVLASVVLRERLDLRGKLGLILGFSGIVLIAVPQLFTSSTNTYAIGVAYIVLAALGITVSNVLIRRVADEVDALMAMGMQMLIGAFPLLIAAWAFEDPRDIAWSTRFVFSLVGLSLPGTALVYWLWFSILQKIPLNRANAFSFLIPIFGLSMGALFFGERVGWLEVGGIVLALLGIVAVNSGGTLRAAPSKE